MKKENGIVYFSNKNTVNKFKKYQDKRVSVHFCHWYAQ